MANGKAGDHPLTDVITHQAVVFTPEVDDLILRLNNLMTRKELEDLVDWLNPPPIDDLEQTLRAHYERLLQDAKARGWEIK